MIFTYTIEGMHCAACIEKIKSALPPHIKMINITLNPPMLQIESEEKPSLNELNSFISSAGNYKLKSITNHKTEPHSDLSDKNKIGFQAYYPIFLIVSYIVGVASINNIHSHEINWIGWMNHFMAGFFLVFSAFKFLDIRGFAEGYSTYDLLARRWYTYGFIYPFLELSLGILYLAAWLPVTTQILTIFIMGFSTLGVINSLLKKQKLKW